MKPSVRKTNWVGCTELLFLVQRLRGASGVSKLPVEVSERVNTVGRDIVFRLHQQLIGKTDEAGN
jgi:hypothetical protein